MNIPLGTSGKTALEVAREAAKLAGKLGESGSKGKRTSGSRVLAT